MNEEWPDWHISKCHACENKAVVVYGNAEWCAGCYKKLKDLEDEVYVGGH